MRNEDADFIIAVDVAGQHEKKQPRNVVEAVYRSYSLMNAERKHSSLHLADLVIRLEVGQYAAFDFSKVTECIAAGEEAADYLIPEIKAFLTHWRV